jgi:hypothetical protein
VLRKDRFIIDRTGKGSIYSRQKPATDKVQNPNLLRIEVRQSAQTVVYLTVGFMGPTIPYGITDHEDLLIPEADLPYELNGKRIWMRQKRSSLRVEDTTRQPV